MHVRDLSEKGCRRSMLRACMVALQWRAILPCKAQVLPMQRFILARGQRWRLRQQCCDREPPLRGMHRR